MLAVEAQRTIPSSKKEKHFVDYRPLVALLEHLDLPADVFSKSSLSLEGLSERLTSSLDGLVAKLLSLDSKRQPLSLLDNLYGYLSQEDELVAADLIFVPGAKTQLRIDKAIELYKQGFAKTILTSGKSPFYKNNHLSEAEWYKSVAVSAGVPEADILVEARSISLPDNVRSSLNYLDDQGFRYSTLILVNSPYVQRRAWAHFQKYVDDKTRLIRVNSQTKPALRQKHWFKSETGIRVVVNEFAKMKVAETFNSI